VTGMDEQRIGELLEGVRSGAVTTGEALERLRDFPVKDLGYAALDTQRELRTGRPEVVYCAGKSMDHLRGILEHLVGAGADILATRAEPAQFEAVRGLSAELRFDPLSRTITLRRSPRTAGAGSWVAVVTAGTSDIPVAEEAAVTAEMFGSCVRRIFDVGVAGLHRLLSRLDDIRGARVVVAVAGMEGALASVVGGLVRAPVIAVPTSVGYGASFGGLAALLAMLNSCAAGVAVVNIDNGFGAGYLASVINGIA
jgi:pyridinium-3,5-biscarboxylic acid mononucleotide synthase